MTLPSLDHLSPEDRETILRLRRDGVPAGHSLGVEAAYLVYGNTPAGNPLHPDAVYRPMRNYCAPYSKAD